MSVPAHSQAVPCQTRVANPNFPSDEGVPLLYHHMWQLALDTCIPDEIQQQQPTTKINNNIHTLTPHIWTTEVPSVVQQETERATVICYWQQTKTHQRDLLTHLHWTPSSGHLHMPKWKQNAPAQLLTLNSVQPSVLELWVLPMSEISVSLYCHGWRRHCSCCQTWKVCFV